MVTSMINEKRLTATFLDLVRIDSVSREEGALCRYIRGIFDDLGVDSVVDNSAEQTLGDCGNLIGKFRGRAATAPSLLLSAHMDTVEPGRKVQPVFRDGVFRSQGDTILGADDKCGIAIILEALRCIVERDLPCGPLELVFTTCEEVGMLGAKHLVYEHLSSKMGYVLDTRDPDAIVAEAPAACRLTFTITGKAAHAGASPEKGINAIVLAGRAVAAVKSGRLDHETTCNVGLIQGGVATNVVPPVATVSYEVRSHNDEKLKAVTDEIVGSFQKVVQDPTGVVEGVRPELAVEQVSLFDRLSLDPGHEVIRTAMAAAENQQRELRVGRSSGGSDANILSQNGIQAVVLGTGCEKVHTVDEYVALSDMIRGTVLLLEIIRLHSQKEPVSLGLAQK